MIANNFNMNQKGFANIVLIILVVVLAAALGYVTLVNKSPENSPQTTTPPPPQSQPVVNNPPQVTPPATPSKQSFAVTSPNGGEEWRLKGSDYQYIKWSGGSGNDHQSVDAYLEESVAGKFVTLGRIIPFSQGSIGWIAGAIDLICKTPLGFHGGGLEGCEPTYVAPGEYYVRLVDRKTKAEDRSDRAFKIVAGNAFHVESLSPQNGEQLTLGSTYDIKWCGRNLPMGTGASNIFLVKADNSLTPILLKQITSNLTQCPTTNSFPWQVSGSGIVPGENYRIFVDYWSGGGYIGSDYSGIFGIRN